MNNPESPEKLETLPLKGVYKVVGRSLALILWVNNPIYQLLHMSTSKIVISVYSSRILKIF